MRRLREWVDRGLRGWVDRGWTGGYKGVGMVMMVDSRGLGYMGVGMVS